MVPWPPISRQVVGAIAFMISRISSSCSVPLGFSLVTVGVPADATEGEPMAAWLWLAGALVPPIELRDKNGAAEFSFRLGFSPIICPAAWKMLLLTGVASRTGMIKSGTGYTTLFNWPRAW